MGEISFAGFRHYLRARSPEVEALFEEVERGEREAALDAGISVEEVDTGTYGIMSDVFWWGVFHPALERGDVRLLRDCYAIVEEIIRDGDRNLLECLRIRVVSYLETAEWSSASFEYGGPGLRGMFEEHAMG